MFQAVRTNTSNYWLLGDVPASRLEIWCRNKDLDGFPCGIAPYPRELFDDQRGCPFPACKYLTVDSPYAVYVMAK